MADSSPSLVCATPRLLLRRLSLADAPFILRLLDEPSFIENIGDRGVRTLDDARAYLLNGPLASYERFGFGLFRVDLAATSQPIGLCGLIQRDWLDAVDVGFALFPAFRAKGYAHEAALGVIEWGRAARGIARVAGIVKAGNVGSIRVLEKLGLRFTRVVTSPEGLESHLYEPC